MCSFWAALNSTHHVSVGKLQASALLLLSCVHALQAIAQARPHPPLIKVVHVLL